VEELLAQVERRKYDIRRAILEWGRHNIRDFPWRRNRSPYKVLVSEILLRRTTASAVLRVYEAFLARYPDVWSLAKADLGELESLLKTIGYHKERALILQEIANVIVCKYGGEIPKDKDELLRIPHIGSYIAGAILSLGYGIPAAMVDSNVERIYSRVFAKSIPKKGLRHAILAIAEGLVPPERHEVYNYALLDLGATVCRYDRPRCKICPLSGLCDTANLK